MTDFSAVVAAPSGRFDGIERPYGVEDVLKLRGSIPIEHTLARRGRGAPRPPPPPTPPAPGPSTASRS
jgi:hypothetical protein